MKYIKEEPIFHQNEYNIYHMYWFLLKTDGATSSVTEVINVVDDEAIIVECEETSVVTWK